MTNNKEKVLLLSKDGCPKCVNLKMFLDLAMDHQFDDDYRIVHKDKDSEEYDALVEKHDLQAMPVLIRGDKLVIGFDPAKTVDIFENA